MDAPAPAVLEPSELGRVLRKRREALELSRSALARRSGVQEVTIAKIENGDREPKYSTLMNIARGLEIEDLNELKPPSYDEDMAIVSQLADALTEITDRARAVARGGKLGTPSGVAQLAARLTVNQ